MSLPAEMLLAVGSLSLSLPQMLELTALGFAAGVMGGLLGIGGGLIMIPAMLLVLGDRFGPDSLHLYKLAAISTSVVLSIPAVRRHMRAGAIHWGMVRSMILSGVVGVVLGVGASSFFTHEYTHVLRRIFGVFMLFVVFANVLLAPSRTGGLAKSCPRSRHWRRLGLFVGGPAGAIAGLLGIGGGVWAVPMQNIFFGVRLQVAIANSAATIIGIAACTTIFQSVAVSRIAGVDVSVGWWLALFLAPGALLGGLLGATLTHRLPMFWLRQVFHILLAATGAQLAIG